MTIPKGSFSEILGEAGDKGEFVFRGLVAGVALRAQIVSIGGNSYRIQAQGRGANLTGNAPPLPVALTIGDDGGTTLANIGREDD